MPVINGVYLKDFTALPGAVADANIIPIAITGNQIAYRTTVAGIVTDARVTSKLLTGLSVTGGAISATDSILTAFGKVQSQINGKQGTVTLTTTGTSGAATFVSNTLNIPNYGSALTGYVPYTGATQDVDLGAFKLNAQSFHVKGTAGNGHLSLKHQSSAATASANESSLFADSNGNLSFQNANLYLNKFVTSANTANRTYTFPDATGTVALVGGSGVGTVTSVAALTLGTSGTDLSSSVANGTTTPVITLNVPDASATNRGVVTTGNQTFAGEKTFNNNLISSATSWFSTIGLRKITPGSDVPFSNSAGTVEFNFGNGGNFTANSLIKSGGTSAQFLKADGSVDNTSYGIGTVTSVAAITLGTSGTDLSSTVATGTTTPVITLNVPTASASNRGALSSGDWSTFNGKQNSITLTTTGSSGASTLIGSTLNIPNYGDALSGYLPLTGGTLTGALSGTSASFSSTATATSFIPSGATVATNGMYLSAANTLDFATNSVNRLSISSTGAATFTGALSGTSATFSSTLAVTGTGVVQGGLTVGATPYQNYATLFLGGSTTVGSAQYAIITDASMNGVSNTCIFANAKIRASATATNAYGLYVSNPEMGAGATLTNAYGLYIANQTSGATLNYSIYSNGGLNYFAGATTLGAALTGTSATFSSTVTATGFFESSSIKGKNIIQTNPLTNINPDVIQYTRKTDENKDVRYGYSAEQIHSLMPELTDKDVTSVKYLDVHTILIAQLQQEIKELKAKLN